MSVNFSQNPEYYKQQGNFNGKYTPEAPQQFSMLKNLGLPSTREEAIKFAPFAVGGVLFSKLVSAFGTVITRLNPKKNPNITLAESFEKSRLATISSKIDAKILPVLQKHSAQINTTKAAIKKYTPNWIKNLIEKVKIGVTPKNGMALHQYKGLTHSSSDYFLGLVKGLPAEQIEKLGIGKILENSTNKRISAATAVRQITKKLKNIPASQLGTIKVTVPRNDLFKYLFPTKTIKLNFIDELNKSRAFIAGNAKTAASKMFQKGVMSVSEAAGGGVIGGFSGMIMNSIYVASALKRTWDAPWGEKFSTFMEAALVDFCGGYLMMLLGSRISYKLLGLKNADKSAQDLLRISKLTQQITKDKNTHKIINSALDAVKKGAPITPEFLAGLQTIGVNVNAAKTTQDITTALEALQKTSASTINSSIDKLKMMKAFKKQGFFKDLINRPLRWIGNFFSVGLESLPAKVAEAGKVSAFRAGLQKFNNILKGIAGYPIRFILVLCIVTPPLTKLVTKISHKLFGKPTKSAYADDDENDKKKPNKQGIPKVSINDFANFTKATGFAKNYAEEQMRLAGKLPPAPKQSHPDEIKSELINKTVSRQKNKPDTPLAASMAEISPAKYVPNIMPTDFTNPNLAKVINQKLNYSDKLEKHVKKELYKAKTDNLYDF